MRSWKDIEVLGGFAMGFMIAMVELVMKAMSELCMIDKMNYETKGVTEAGRKYHIWP